jgi:hypothetical protein
MVSCSVVNRHRYLFNISDLEEIRDDVRTRLWFTYRKGFPAIGRLDTVKP